MMTPQEVAEYTFTRVKLGGYHVTDVDDFMEKVTTDYTTLYKDNAVLKSKLKVLATKLAEYRQTEESMRSLVASARTMAEDIKAQAEATRQQMLAEADQEVAEYRAQLRSQIADAEAQLAAAQQSTREFVTTVRNLVLRENDFLDQLSAIKGAQPEEEEGVELRQEIDKTAAAIDDSIRRMLSEDELAELDAAGAAAEADPIAAYNQELPAIFQQAGAVEEEPAVEEPTRRVDFAAVDFSQDYNA
jgi:cell division initiation protein